MKRIIDLFCGTGGFSKGFENSRNCSYSTVLGIDLLPVAIDTFRLNHSQAVGICGDIRELRRSDIIESIRCGREDIDLIIGGPPCQGFSSIRPFRSCNDDDPRNTLFEEFASFVNFFRPKMFVLENVVGLATHKNGSTIESMANCFDGIGYDSDWKILNAAHFGVPQKRERLILIGAMKGAKIEFPTPTHQYVGSTIGYSRKSRMLLPTTPVLLNQSMKLQPSITVWDAISDLPPLRSGERINNIQKTP